MNKGEYTACLNCGSRSKSVFCELNNAEVQQLDAAKKNMQFKKGEKIFEEGAYPHGLYCVSKGKIKITQVGVDGKEQIVHLAKDGDVMGYRAILSGDKYSCSAIAMEDSFLCFIPSNLFIGMIEKNPKFSFQILRLFSEELKSAERNITSTAQKPVKERVAQSIFLLKENYGFEKDGCTINLSITRDELASIVGTVRETAIRVLTELSKSKIIELNGKKIKIIDEKKLIAVANSH